MNWTREFKLSIKKTITIKGKDELDKESTLNKEDNHDQGKGIKAGSSPKFSTNKMIKTKWEGGGAGGWTRQRNRHSTKKTIMTKVGGTQARSSPKLNKEYDQDQVGRGDELDKKTNIQRRRWSQPRGNERRKDTIAQQRRRIRPISYMTKRDVEFNEKDDHDQGGEDQEGI